MKMGASPPTPSDLRAKIVGLSDSTAKRVVEENMKRIWSSLPWNNKKVETAADDDQELQDMEEGNHNSREISPSLETQDDDEVDTGAAVPDIFSAIQLYDIDELTKLLDKSPHLINEAKRAGLYAMHTACHFKNLQILEIVLNRGALVSQLDDDGNTALHIAVAEGWHEGVEELLRYGASPDVKCNPPETLPSSEVIVQTPLHLAVRKGDFVSTTMMLDHKPDLTLCDSNRRSVLHLAAHSLNSKVLLKLLDEKPCQELLATIDHDGNTIMHAALVPPRKIVDEEELEQILRALFESGADVNSVNNHNETPLFQAARCGLSKAVEFLLSLGADLKLLTSKNQSLLHGACLSGNSACLRHLLNNSSLRICITKADNDGNEPFHYAVRSSSFDCCELLLNSGDHLTRKDRRGITRCSLILQYLPSASELLKNMFDRCINLSDKPEHDPEFRINFDYSVLQSTCDNSENSTSTSLVYDLNKNGESETLLKHPLVESFLYSKWVKIKIFFYTSVFIYFLFMLLHTFYIVSVYKKDPMAFLENDVSIWIFRFLHILMYLLIVIPEIVITISHPKRMVKHWESLTKCISILSSAFVVFSTKGLHGEQADDGSVSTNNVSGDDASAGETGFSFQRYMAAISAFFGWVELMMLCGRFPALGVYALMFTRIAKSMLLFIMAFITLLIGFSVCFLVLFYKNDSFGSFWKSVVKTLMMMVGEIDYEGLVEKDTPVISYITLVVFLFLVSILVINLLIGLAVNDIANLELLGKIERLSKQASFLVSFEHFLVFLKSWKIFPRRLTSLLENRPFIKQRINIPLNKRRFKTGWKYKMPSEIIEAALIVGNQNKENNEQNDTKELENGKDLQHTLNKILKAVEFLHPELRL